MPNKQSKSNLIAFPTERDGTVSVQSNVERRFPVGWNRGIEIEERCQPHRVFFSRELHTEKLGAQPMTREFGYALDAF